MRVLRGRALSPLFHGLLDLGPPCGERLDGLAGHAHDLEPPVGVGLLDGVAELLEFSRQFAPVHRAQQHLRGVQALVRHRPPLAVGALEHVRDHRMGVQRRIEVSGGIVAERGNHRFLIVRADHAAGRRILHPGLGGVFLEPAERANHGPIVGVDDARVAADQRGKGYGLGRGEGQIAPGAVVYLSVLTALAEPPT